jgi:hypothetical protein
MSDNMHDPFPLFAASSEQACCWYLPPSHSTGSPDLNCCTGWPPPAGLWRAGLQRTSAHRTMSPQHPFTSPAHNGRCLKGPRGLHPSKRTSLADLVSPSAPRLTRLGLRPPSTFSTARPQPRKDCGAPALAAHSLPLTKTIQGWQLAPWLQLCISA